MSSYLIEEAIKDVWCAPDQDNQIRLAPARITSPTGDMVTTYVMNRQVSLPNKTSRFHVYMVGRAWPALLGLIPIKPDWAVVGWKKLSDAVNYEPLFADLYNDKGQHYPLFSCYYLYTTDGALIFAVEIYNDHPVKLNSDKLWFRFYTNAYYYSGRQNASNPYTFTNGMKIKNSGNIVSLQGEVNTYRAMPGAVICYVNGKYRSDLSAANVKIGDYAEYIYDASVKQVPRLRVNTFPVFNSSLDQKYKYLVHYPFTEDRPVINYQDDVDVYIIANTADGKDIGVYYHHNLESSIRMVTHRDYSIVVDFYEYLASQLTTDLGISISLRDLDIQIFVRNSGFDRNLIYDNNRIFEMYKLDDGKIVPAMTGSDAGVSVWKADALESSAYTKLMRSRYSDIDSFLVENAYGYNGISKLLGDAPLKPVQDSNFLKVDLPMGLYDHSTMYEYDANGLLIDSRAHTYGTVYRCANPNTALIEGIAGIASPLASVIFGTDNIQLPTDYDYRVYMCYLISDVPNEEWKDITGTDLYGIVNGKLVWANKEFDQYLMVRTDENFNDFTVNLSSIAGTFYFSLYELQNREGHVESRVMGVPPGDLDIWINGHPAIRDLDYVVKFPKIYITNKTFLNQPVVSSNQVVRVRCTGFCNSDLTMDAIEDKGFIEYGVLSNNGKFDIRDDKVLRIIVNGALKHRDDLVFSEQHQGVSVVNAINGLPYQISDIKVPFRGATSQNTYDLRKESLAIDAEVSSYMTQYLPQPPRDGLSAINSRYPMVSPFICHIANDLASGQFDMNKIQSVLSDNDVLTLCKPYEFLLDFDPINKALGISSKYVVIHPVSTTEDNPLSIDLDSYRFLMRVAKLYAGDLVDFSNFITIKNT